MFGQHGGRWVLMAGVGGLLAAGCSTPGPGTDVDPTGTITVGEPVDRGQCETEVDCPVGYRCIDERCVLEYDDQDNDGFTTLVDCNDQNGGIHPDAEEICNGVDDNCNNAIDEGVANSCGECGPDPIERCDLEDNDCDGFVDEECLGGTFVDIEPNDGLGQCQNIALPITVDDHVNVTGFFDPAGDEDGFCFHALAGQGLTFEVDSSLLGAPTDAKITLYDASTGVLLAYAEDGFAQGRGYDPYLEYDFLADVSVRAVITNLGGTGGSNHLYIFRITSRRPPGACDDFDGDEVSSCDGDCNNNDALIFPGQTEVCDGTDNNCDGIRDEGCPVNAIEEREANSSLSTCNMIGVPASMTGTISVQLDQDFYCFFAPKNAQIAFDIDAKEAPLLSPLDTKITLYDLNDLPLGNVLADNDDGVDPETGYSDVASDSFLSHTFWVAGLYGLKVQSVDPVAASGQHRYVLNVSFENDVTCVDEDGDGVSPCEGDCDETDPTVYYGAPEICDGRDNSCDNVGDPGSCIGDLDGDGFSGLTGDCDDSNPMTNPNGVELCDGFDNNCNGETDEGVLNACGTCGYAPPEICGNEQDDDCDGVTDTDCNTDEDGDGITPDQGDCDDTRADVFPAVGSNPAAEEICDNVDNDCDGTVDEYVKNNCGTCDPPRGELIELCNGIDDNCNGLLDDGAVNACGQCGPAPEEVCDGFDNDCDAEIDEGVTNRCGQCGPLPVEACDGQDNDCDDIIDNGCDSDTDQDGFTPRAGDCDDGAATTHWGATEICDGVDNNCNGWIDDAEGCSLPTETEPNNLDGDCNPLTLPARIRGVLADLADRDHFCVTLPVDASLSIDIDARDIGSPVDSQLQIFWNGGSQAVDTNDNASAPGDGFPNTSDSYLSFTTTEEGELTIRVSAVGTASAAEMFYELIVFPTAGCFDLDRDGNQACDGDCNDFSSAMNVGAIDICDGLDNNCRGGPDERCFNGCFDDILEDNDTAGTATPLSPGFHGGLQMCGGDADNFLIEGLQGQSLLFDVSQAVENSDDPGIPMGVTLYNTDRFSVLTTSPDPATPTISATLPTDGTYRVAIESAFGKNIGYDITVILD